MFGSILVNLMSIPPLAEKNLSVPGCWACENSRSLACLFTWLLLRSIFCSQRTSSACFCLFLSARRGVAWLALFFRLTLPDPDMLEVGVTNMQKSDCGPNGTVGTCEPLSVTEARTHFAGMCTVSVK